MDEHDRNATHLSTTQAAHAAGISRQRMLQLIKDQKVPAIETRHGYRVARDAVEYLKSERRLINDQRALVNVGHDLAEEMQRIADRLEPTVLRDIKTFEETIKRASPLAVAEAVAPFTAAMQDTMRAEVTRAPMRRYAEEMEAIRARMSDESRQALQIAAKLVSVAATTSAAVPVASAAMKTETERVLTARDHKEDCLAQTTADGGITNAMDDRKMSGGEAAMQAVATGHFPAVSAAAEHRGLLQATRGLDQIDIAPKFGQLHGPADALKVFAARPNFLAGLAGQIKPDTAGIVEDALKERMAGMMERRVEATDRSVPARLGDPIEMSVPPIPEMSVPPSPLDKGDMLPVSRESQWEEKVDDLSRQVAELKALVLGRQEATQAPMTEHPTTERGAHWQREHGTSDPAVVLDRFAAMRAKTRGEAEDATAIVRASRDGGLARE